MNPFQVIPNLCKAATTKFKTAFYKSKPAQLSWGQAKYYKHLDDITPKTISVDGLQFTYKHRHSIFHTYEEIFVREIYRFQAATKTPLIIDCGANIGFSILYFKKIFPQAQVIGFEPDPENFALLQSNLQQNPQFNQNIQLEKKAIWIHNEGISFQADGSEGSKINEAAAQGSTKVETQDLKELLRRYPSVDFLKVDIEGAENTVMPAVKEELHRVQNLFLEYHGRTDELAQLNQLLIMFEQQGFSVYITTADDSLQQPFIEKHTSKSFDVQLNIFCFRQ